jgi:hypothetical protein
MRWRYIPDYEPVWKRWFAWYPVKVPRWKSCNYKDRGIGLWGDGFDNVWLEWIEHKRYITMGDTVTYRRTEYRFPKKETV